MKDLDNRIAVMIFGKPGSGKSTQAYFFVDKFGLNHFDTGKEIEKTVHDPVLANDPVIRREREIFDLGLLKSGFDARAPSKEQALESQGFLHSVQKKAVDQGKFQARAYRRKRTSGSR